MTSKPSARTEHTGATIGALGAGRLVCLLAILVTSVAGIATATPVQGSRQQLPNIVLIVSDDQGYADLGLLGKNRIRTPNLDRLADQGVRLTSFYVTWPACTPSRASLLTGRYPQRNGTYDMIRNDMVDYGHQYTPEQYSTSPERILGTDVREVMLPQVLKKAGYRCGIFGKWDGGQLKRYLPLQRGFDVFHGFTNTGIDYWTHERYGVPSMYRDNLLTIEDRGTYATNLFTDQALRFLEENRRRPFFLYLPFNAPHGASNLDPQIRGRAQAPKRFLELYDSPQDDQQAKRVAYMAAVTCMGDAIRQILERLRSYGLEDDTLVIFMSDNGGSSSADNQPLRGRKGHLFEGGVRVPFIARWPGVIPAGSVSEEFLTSLEIYPTLSGIAGARVSETITQDGFNMLAVLQGKAKSERTEMFWQRRQDKAVRVGNYKWVESAAGTGLFDLSKDIGEQHDLSRERPELVKKLVDRFQAWRQAMDESEPRGPFKDY